MFSPKKALAAYQAVELDARVLSATPHQLILMLFDGALLSLKNASQFMIDRKTAAKGAAITKAINIITNGLQASLDQDKDKELTERLYSLYDYMCDRLLIANMKNQVELIDEVVHLLIEIREAWAQIGATHTTHTLIEINQQPNM